MSEPTKLADAIASALERLRGDGTVLYVARNNVNGDDVRFAVLMPPKDDPAMVRIDVFVATLEPQGAPWDE